ncbi:PQQ-binding-like beta-propeller repeat protein [Actinopolymorpha pittospori]|nr:PQQ-binding-like beta-propeller repeat protein [Actinopolymorpha pittospori]
MPQFYRNLGQLAPAQAVVADFPLLSRPNTRSGSFTFGNLADTHLNAQYGDQVAEVSSTARDLAFIQISGDITQDGEEQEFIDFRKLTARSAVPVWSAVGNHEYSKSQRWNEYKLLVENYRRYVGPEWYSFDYGNRHFVTLDNNRSEQLPEQLEWLRRDLELNAGDKRIVVIKHAPQNTRIGGPGHAELLNLLKKYNVELFLTGHRHSNQVDDDFVDGARYIQTNSSYNTADNSPRGFRFIEMHGDLANPFRMFGLEKSLTITNPAPGSEVARGAFTQVQVNAYDTANRVREVSYRLDGGQWTKLKPTGDFTWFTEHGRSGLPAGRHSIEARAVDEAGKTWTKSATFTLSDQPVQAPRAGADWSQHHGDPAHLGVATDELSPEDLGLAWSYRTPDMFLTGSPVIVDGIVYAGTRDDGGDGKASLYAVELATGKRLREFPTDASVHGSPAVANGLVYVPTLKGTLYALDARTGELRWQRNPELPVQGQQSYYGVALDDGKVYYAYQAQEGEARNGLLLAFDAKTGKTVWKAQLMGGDEVEGAPAVVDGRVYVGGQDETLLSYDAATGERLWVTERTSAVQDGTPTIAGGRVFIASLNRLVARNAATGKVLWTYKSPGESYMDGSRNPSTAAVVGDTAYMGFPDGNVTALDVATGTPRWTNRIPGSTYLGGVSSSPTISGDTVYIGSNNGFLYGLERSTGKIVWKYEVGTWVAASPAISGNTLVAAAWDGNLYAFTEQK